MNSPQLQQPTVASPAWIVSLCFWFALTFAACVYAVVALAPKFSVWNQVRHEYRGNNRQLIALERDVDYLERVEEALRTDPEFVRRLSGASRQHNDEAAELIPVSGELLFGYVDPSENASQNLSQPPPYHSAISTLAISTLASHSTLRISLLSFSALLTVFAFTFLNDAGAGFVHTTGRLIKAAAVIPIARYFSSAEVDAGDKNESMHVVRSRSQSQVD
ncbi:MAG: hypothetical protein ABGZ53_33855 [Fuerstiella sp.]